MEQIEENDCTPSLSQACRFKKISQGEGLTPEVIAEIMSEDKANQKERIKIIRLSRLKMKSLNFAKRITE